MKFTTIKTAIILTLGLSAIFFCFSAVPALAENDTSKILDEIKNIKPAPRIELPGLNFSQEPKVVEEGGTTFLYIPYFGEYMSAIYKYAVIVAGILSVVIIMFGGFTWLTSGGSPEKITEAKKYIVGAVTGLIIAAGSYALLYTINPNLVQFKSLKIAYIKGIPLQLIDSKIYQKITGEAVLPKGEAVKKAIQAGREAGLTDDCLMVSILAMESGANPNALGHDENASIPVPIGSRKKFLLSGVKYFGASFTPPASKETYNYKVHNLIKIFNDDNKIDPTKTDYNLDWRFSHGIGLGQITIFQEEKTKCNGRPGKMFGGVCYSLADLLTVEKNLLYTANLFKSNLNCVAKKGLTGEYQIMGAFYAYNAGCGSVGKIAPTKLSEILYVQKAMKFYQTCKQKPDIIPDDPQEIIPPTDTYSIEEEQSIHQ